MGEGVRKEGKVKGNTVRGTKDVKLRPLLV